MKKKPAKKKPDLDLRIAIHQPMTNDRHLMLPNVCMQILLALKLSEEDRAYQQMFGAIAKMTLDRDLIGQCAIAFSGNPDDFARMVAQGELARIAAPKQFITALKACLDRAAIKIVFVPDDDLSLEAANALHVIRMGLA